MIKKISRLSAIALVMFSTFGGSLFAAENVSEYGYQGIDTYYTTGANKVSGNWYSSSVSSKGTVSIGTENKSGSNKTYKFYIYDQKESEDIYYKSVNLSNNSEYDSGRRTEWVGNHVQFKVLGSGSHIPWGWTGV